MPKQMEKERVRIIDIAEELGVSTATVSNVIHGKTKKISDETVRRVQELLEERQYIPSMAAVLLAQNDSRIIGVVVNDHPKYEGHVLEDAFVSASLNYLSAEIEAAGFFMMVKVGRAWNEISRFASMWNMEGLVLIGFCEQDYTNLRAHMKVPFVVYDGYFERPERFCNLMIDNYSGGFLMGQHFKEKGCVNAVCISDNDTLMDHERITGFAAGLEQETELLLVPVIKAERYAFYEKHLSELLRYDGIFAVSDYYAIELMQFLQRQGIKVPEAVRVAGFDDNPICQNVYPSLTTIHQDGAERARLAVRMLRQLKNGTESGKTVKTPVQLVVRESTK